MSRFATILILFYSLISTSSGADMTLSGQFLPYETYYIGSIDLTTGTSDVQFFNFLLSDLSGEQDYDPPITFDAEFKIDILSPELGFPNMTTMILIKTKSPVSMENPIYLDNRDFNKQSTEILDTHGNSVSINFCYCSNRCFTISF